MKAKIFSVLLATALIAGTLAGCGNQAAPAADSTAAAGETATEAGAEAAQPTVGGDYDLVTTWYGDPESLDVALTTQDYEVPLNVYDRMFEIVSKEDGTTELVPSLVSEYSVSADGLTYSFTLRDDVKFSDGTQLTAEDIAFSLTRIEAMDTSVQSDFAACIKGAEAAMETEGYSYDDMLEGIEVVDATHLNITLEYPYGAFLYELATPSCSIVSKAAVVAAGDSYGSEVNILGSGAYKVDSWDHSTMELSYNEYYWGEEPDVKTVKAMVISDPDTLSMMFQAGEVDMLDCDKLDSAVVDATYKTGAYDDKIVTFNRLATTYMTFNANNEFLSNVKVRQAVQKSIDRQTILDTVYGGQGVLIDGIYSSGMVGFTADNQGWLKYDPEAAKALIAEAGYGEGEITLELAADADAASSVMLVLQIIQQNLEAVGIKCSINNMDHSAWLDARKAGDLCMFVGTWTADFNDPDNFIYTFFGNADKSKARSLNYSDEAVMSRVEAARAILDNNARMAEYAALEKKIVEEDAAWEPLFTRTHTYVLGQKVASFEPHWAGYADYQYKGVKLVK